MLTAQAHNWTRLFSLLRILIIKTGAALSESGLSLFWSSFSDFSSFFFVVAKLKIQKKKADGAVFMAQVGERIGPNREGWGVCGCV